MKVASLIARKGDSWESLGQGVEIGELSAKLDSLIDAKGVVAKGKSEVKYDEAMLLTTHGIAKRRKL